MSELAIPFERVRLDNGLRVLLSQDSSAPVVAVNLWYNVGSKNEPPGRTGFAHLFEHMMFQGSEHVPETVHFAMIEKAGGTLNGTTWLDRTNYFETVPSHYLETVLWLESDRMGFLLPAMTQAKLDNQRDVVKNERRWRVDNQPYGDWDERLQRMLYPPDHPYHHSVIGSMADLDAASLADVEQFFRTYYAPNNAVLTVCGDFERSRALDLISRYFGTIPAGPPVPPVPGETALPARLERRAEAIVEQDITLPRVYTAYRIPPFGSPGFYPALVAATILGDGKGAVLYRRLVRTGTAQDVIAYAFPVVLGAAMLVTWATANPTTTTAALAAALEDAIDELAGVSERDVQRAVELIASTRLIDLQRVDERADALSMYETLFDDAARVNLELQRVRAVTPADVHECARQHLQRDCAAMITYVPGNG